MLHPQPISTTCQKISSSLIHSPSSSSPHHQPHGCLIPLLCAIAHCSWINTANIHYDVMRGRLSSVTPPKSSREAGKVIEKKEEKELGRGVTRTLTVNYLEYMAIRAAMSVSERLSVIWSLGMCRRIHSTDSLLKAEGLSAPLCSAVSTSKPFYFL